MQRDSGILVAVTRNGVELPVEHVPEAWLEWAIDEFGLENEDPELGRDFHAVREACNNTRLRRILAELVLSASGTNRGVD